MPNKYSECISDEELTMLPLGQFGGSIETVDSLAKLNEACDHLISQTVIGFDTETRPSFKAGMSNRTALLQLSTDEKCYLFRLCMIRFDKALLKIMESRDILKVGVGIKCDLDAMQKIRRFKPANFVDMQELAGCHGIKDRSLRKMAGIITGLRISKAKRLSNWEAAKLTPAQQVYAATDAWICLEMYRKLSSS